MTGFVVITMMAIWPGFALAETCGKTATQFDLDQCAGAEFRKADTVLNAAYKKVMDRLGTEAPTRKLLIEAQKAWLGFRDAECEFAASDSIGGSIHPTVVALCRTTLTQARTKRLDGYLTCQEGAADCPLPQ